MKIIILNEKNWNDNCYSASEVKAIIEEFKVHWRFKMCKQTG